MSDQQQETPENPNEVTVQETWQESLEGQALEIVTSDAKRQCVQAGPGTGKSYCMTKRLLRLIQQKKVQPHEILAVTFTRTAATDLRKSLEKTLPEGERSFRASTLHSLCFSIVEHESFLNVRGRHPRFLLAVTKAGCYNFEMAPMLADLKAENSAYEGAREQSKRIKRFEALWAQNQAYPVGTPTAALDAAYDTSLKNWLKFHKAMMVGELVKEAYEFMAAEPESSWRKKFKAILVDEYQDLNKVDQTVIDLLCDAAENVCSVVGDLDQSIYSFRCAHPEGLIEYASRDGVETQTMEVSRRCPTSHLNSAQTLIKLNTKRADKYPTALEDAKAGEVHVRRYADRAKEVEGVVAYVKYCLEQGVTEGDILVMAPSRLIGRELRQALRGAEIEALSYFAEEQLEEEEAQRAFTILTLLAKPKDRVSLRCWLGGWKSPQFRSKGYAKVRSHSEANNAELWDVLEAVVSGTLNMPGTSALVEPFKELKGKLTGLKDKKGQELLDALFPDGSEWAEDIRTLAGGTVHEDVTAEGLYELLVDSITQPIMPTEVSHVRVMSLHKSKGLTARASVIAGAIEGLVPRGYDAVKSFLTQADHEEEQRRLFYVAMTRSTEFLLISSPTLVDMPFKHAYQLPGRRSGTSWQTTPTRFSSAIGLPAVKSSLTFP